MKEPDPDKKQAILKQAAKPLPVREELTPSERQLIANQLIDDTFSEIRRYTTVDGEPIAHHCKEISRMVKILQSIIVISEKKGLKVKPHKAILKGDMLQQIIVKFYVSDLQDYTKRLVDRQILIDARTTTTVWEFVDQVARMLGLGYKHIKLSVQDEDKKWRVIRDYDYGKILSEIGLKAMSTVMAERMPIPDKVSEVPLCEWKEKKVPSTDQGDDKKTERVPDYLTPQCRAITQHLFNLIKSPVKDVNIDRNIALDYLQRAMNKKLQVDSDEVNLLMKNAHGQSVDLAGFEKYIKEKCKTPDTLYKHFKAYGIGKNLKKFTDEDITLTLPHDMPRYIISNEPQGRGGGSKF